jgi:hypothetical protein
MSQEYQDYCNTNYDPEDVPTGECWQCGGIGLTPGCFEDCCSGADCDPDDAETCCSPSRCDVCGGKGSYSIQPLPSTTCTDRT